MRILFLNDFIPPHSIVGPGKRNFELAQELKRLGNDVYFITSCQDKKLEGEEIIDGIKIFNIYSKYSYRFKSYVNLHNFFIIEKIKSIMKNIRPDVVHADIIHFHLSYASLKIAKQYSRAVFLTTRDFMLFSAGKFLQKERECGEINYKVSWLDNFKRAKKRFNPLRNILIKRYLKYVDKIFAVSNELAKSLDQNDIYNVEVIHNGLNIVDINPVDFEFKNSKTIFLLGRINETKGVYALLNSFPIIISKVPDAEITIAGVKDEEKEKIEKYIRKLNLNKAKIKIFKRLIKDELKSAFESAAVIVSPSLYPDPFPGVNLEAALYRKPVVTTCFGGAKEFIIDGKTGYVVNPYNKKELADKITDLLIDEEKARRFGMANFERLKNHFSINKQAEIILGWYKKFI